MKVMLSTCGAWHLPHTAKAFDDRDALAGAWLTVRNRGGIDPALYRRCRLHSLATLPFDLYAPQIVAEKAFYTFFPLWKFWQARQPWPQFDVFHSMMGFASEGLDHAERVGALKVVDCPNSHPTTYYGYWQRECDLWCPGETVPIPRWMFARMNRELARADLVIVQSNFARDSMVANGIPAHKVFVNPMGVDTSTFTQRKEVPAKPRFVCVATICLRKGHQYLFRAFQQVKAALPDAELVCVGDYKTDFRKERPKWEGSFTHHPKLTHQQIAELFQNTTAFVFPSQEEGIGRAQIEALASGVPVIGTYTAGTTTVVDDGKEGFIVPSNDPAQLAARMIQLAQDRALNRAMGHAAFQRCHHLNSWQDYGDRLLAEFQRRLVARDQ